MGSEDTHTTQGSIYTVIGFIILPAYHAYPETRLDVYDFITKPVLPVSDHVTGHYPLSRRKGVTC